MGMHVRTERKNWPAYLFDIARMVATRATCPRRQVGAVITVNKRIIATGYNGAPSGEYHCYVKGCDMVDGHCKRTIHAETNAVDIAKHSMLTLDSNEIEMYCTTKPCEECNNYILETFPDIKIYWLEDY